MAAAAWDLTRLVDSPMVSVCSLFSGISRSRYVGASRPPLEDVQRNSKAFEAQKVVTVRGDLDFELGRLILRPGGIFFGVVVEFCAKSKHSF